MEGYLCLDLIRTFKSIEHILYVSYVCPVHVHYLMSFFKQGHYAWQSTELVGSNFKQVSFTKILYLRMHANTLIRIWKLSSVAFRDTLLCQHKLVPRYS